MRRWFSEAFPFRTDPKRTGENASWKKSPCNEGEDETGEITAEGFQGLIPSTTDRYQCES